MNKKTVVYFVFYVLLASFVIAATTLNREEQVLTCSDSDGGLNFNVTGTTNGTKLNGNPYNFTDNCVDNDTVKEARCFTNATGTFAQIWLHDCSDEGKVCLNGACV